MNSPSGTTLSPPTWGFPEPAHLVGHAPGVAAPSRLDARGGRRCLRCQALRRTSLLCARGRCAGGRRAAIAGPLLLGAWAAGAAAFVIAIL